MSTYLSLWLTDVECGITDGLRLYDIVLDLRDIADRHVADKNPALAKRLRKFADEIDYAVAGPVEAAESFIDVKNVVESYEAGAEDDNVEELAA